MLSRTADHLFWMSRYVERAENTARMLDVNYQTSLLPSSADATSAALAGLLDISELLQAYATRYGERTVNGVYTFMVSDERNPSSILSCLGAARENARAVRGTLTTELWETYNQTWLEVQRMLKDDPHLQDPSAFFEWVKFRSHLSRGVTLGTMLADEALHFIRLGTFLERADNTARLLAVKFYGGADKSTTTDEADFYHWSSLLKSVSGFEVYRKVYRDVIHPDRVAELLVLRKDMPRSLRACLHEVVHNLGLLQNQQSDETLRQAGKLLAQLQYSAIDEILDTGLHAFLTQFLDKINSLGGRISQDFLIPVTA